MANEIVFSYDTGSTIYARVFNSTGQVWKTTTNAFEDWSDGNVQRYDIALTDKSTGQYIGDFPSCAAGRYKVNIYKQAGANPAITDTVIGTGEILWSATGEIQPADEDDVTDAHETTDDLINTLTTRVESVLNVYDET